MAVLTRREYVTCIDTVDGLSGAPYQVAVRMLECIASYRVICHQLAPLLHDAIAECDDAQELARLRGTLDDLKRGES